MPPKARPERRVGDDDVVGLRTNTAAAGATDRKNERERTPCGVLGRFNVYARKRPMQSEANAMHHAVQLQLQDTVAGKYAFVSFPTWRKAFGVAVKRPDRSHAPHLYELVRSDVPCKPHLDLDGADLPPGIDHPRQIIARAQDIIRAIFEEEYGVRDARARLPDDAFVWLAAPSVAKAVSLHVILHSRNGPLLVFASNKKPHPEHNHNPDSYAAHLARRVAERDPHVLGLLVDQSVYTKDRAMRLMGCSKFAKRDAIFRPVGLPADFDTWARSVVTWTTYRGPYADESKSACEVVRVPQELPQPVRAAAARNARVGRHVNQAHVHDAALESSLLHERVTEAAHPSAVPVVPRACVRAVEHLVLRVLHPRRAREYPPWIIVGWVLRRARMPAHVWLRFSARCPDKFDAHECVRVWNVMNPEADEEARGPGGLYTFGTLVKWAKDDDARAFERSFGEGDDDAGDERMQAKHWFGRHGYGLYLVPFAYAKRRVEHFAFDPDERCVHGHLHAREYRAARKHHGEPPAKKRAEKRASDEPGGDDEDEDEEDEDDPAASQHVVTCYVDENEDVLATCSHPDCRRTPAYLHRRLGPLRRSCAQPPHAVRVDLRFLQAPEQLPAWEHAYVRQAAITEFVDGAPQMSHDEKLFGKQLADWLRGTYKALCIRSPMGTGKSYMLRRLINERFEGKTVLFVTYRQTLAYEQENKLRGAGFVNYLNLPEGEALNDRARCPRVICQYDSLMRVGPGVSGLAAFDLVVLDEAESLLRHAVSPTVSGPRRMHDWFASLLRASGRVLCLDAFLGELTYEFLCDLEVPACTILNEYQPPRRTFRVTNNDDAWMAGIVDDLRAGKRVAVPCMSAEKAQQIKQRALERVPGMTERNIVMHTAMQSDDGKKALVRVDQLWGAQHVRLLLYTPTIESGCDFSVPCHFHRMYVYVCRFSCLPLGLMQMTGRVRALDDSTVYCLVSNTIRLGAQIRGGNARRVSSEDACTWLRWADLRHSSVYGSDACAVHPERYADGVTYLLPRPDAYLTTLAHVVADKHNANVCYLAVLQDLVESAGCAFELAPDTISNREATKKAKEGATASRKREVLRDLYVTEDEHEIQRIRERVRTNCASEDDKWADYKLSYLEAFGLGDVDDEFVKKHGHSLDANKHTLLLMRLLYPELTKRHFSEDELDEMERIDDLKVACVREVLGALGVHGPFDAETSCGDYYADDFTNSALYRSVSALHDFTRVIGMFRDHVECVPVQWARQNVTETLNTVLGSVGLQLHNGQRQHRVRNQDGTSSRVLSYSYRIERGGVEEMRELVALKRRQFALAEGDYATVNDIARTEVSRYAHLLRRRQPPPVPEAEAYARESNDAV